MSAIEIEVVKNQVADSLQEGVIRESISDVASKVPIFFYLNNGFFHVLVKKNSKKYTVFNTKEGLFEFNKAPFGFCNSPAVFVRFLKLIVQKLRNDGIGESCLTNVQKVLERAQSYGLEIK